jgi:hypothetical protein
MRAFNSQKPDLHWYGLRTTGHSESGNAVGFTSVKWLKL